MWSFFSKHGWMEISYVFKVLCRFLVVTILGNINVKIIIKERVNLDKEMIVWQDICCVYKTSYIYRIYTLIQQGNFTLIDDVLR